MKRTVKNTRKWIQVYGAREHNLKNIDVAVPKESLTVITGPSGSGKSSLALDILFTEGKRRYTESLSAYARQFLGVAKKPDVDRIEGLCPAIAIEQKTVGHNPRSTVGTITEIYDYLRVLYARIGKPHCPRCTLAINPESPENITLMVMEKFNGQVITIAAPVAQEKKGEFTQELLRLFQHGFYRFMIDGVAYKFSSQKEIQDLKLRKTFRHSIEVLLDVVEIASSEQARVQEAVEKAFELSRGSCAVIAGQYKQVYSSQRACLKCGSSFPELEPRLFSFNSPIGACSQCHGLGIVQLWPWNENDPDFWKTQYPDFFGRYAQEKVCTTCFGQRLNEYARSVTIDDKNIFNFCQLSIAQSLAFIDQVQLGETQREIAAHLLREIRNRLQFLSDVGLSYLSLNRTARTLSGGEGQRIRLATQIGSSLSGVLYILDEPSIGLHQRDNDRLIETLKKLRDQGNTVVVVEHDLDTMHAADYLIDMGPAAGAQGGMVTAVGTPDEIKRNQHSLTGAYLAGHKKITVAHAYRQAKQWITIHNACRNNLKNITVSIPLQVVCGISGVSGSGKSTLVMQELVPTLERELAHGSGRRSSKTAEGALSGVENISSLVVIDQSPIGRTPRSNSATYLGIFDEIRKLFSLLPESQARGYTVGRFSFNVSEGRCFECRGEGVLVVSMHFLPDVTMVCKSCKGKRYNAPTLQVLYRGKNIADVLEMTAVEACEFFAAHARIVKRLQLLCDVGLGYLKLGQPSTTLSGGEAQRIKLVDELAKRGNGTLYILDEPTTGLHSVDIAKLLAVLNKLVEKGNSVVVIEHNLDVLKTCDYLIDLGPEGGDAGGMVIAQGTPTEVAGVPASHTGRYLKKLVCPRQTEHA